MAGRLEPASLRMHIQAFYQLSYHDGPLYTAAHTAVYTAVNTAVYTAANTAVYTAVNTAIYTAVNTALSLT